MMKHTLVLLRHGESDWNKENRFTGWTDVDLSEKGIEEAREAGRMLKKEGFEFDIAFTSFLKRATRTLSIALAEMSASETPTLYDWRLNEKHYGALQGLDKAETAKKYGEEKVFKWRRAYDIAPPPLEETDPRHPKQDQLYAGIDTSALPATECLKDVVARVLPYWDAEIAPRIREGKRVLIAAHGNSLRAVIKHIDDISDEEIAHIDLPTGIPLVYELDEDLKPLSHRYLGDPEKIRAAIEKVVNQGKAK